MVAIFTGLGAGFERGSGAALGSGGLLGSGALGRGNDNVAVNAATGNLIISRQDEFLLGKGPDASVARTYNSLGALDDNGDYWRQSTDRRIYGLTGPVSTAGSTVKRVSADGSEITYTWNAAGAYYEATDGAGSYDRLTYDGTLWTWSDGDTDISETYGHYATGNYWRIATQADGDGNALTFTYTSDKLTRITTQNGGYIQYTWNGNGTHINQIEQFGTSAGGTSYSNTFYEYENETTGRLIRVKTDLTLGDSSSTSTYDTWFTYDGSSNRVSRIQQTDGSILDITYDASARVELLTQTAASGDTRTTKFIYFADRTEIIDPRQYQISSTSAIRTVLYHSNGQLTRMVAPPATTGGTPTEVNYTYDTNGNVVTAVTKSGANTLGTTSFAYDKNGNLITTTDATGRSVVRTYANINGHNVLVRESDGVSDYILQGASALTSSAAGSPASASALPGIWTVVDGVAQAALPSTGDYQGLGPKEVIALVTGQTYHFSAEFRVDGPYSYNSSLGSPVIFGGRVLDSSYVYLTHPNVAATATDLGAGWVRLEFDFTATAGQSYIRPYIYRRDSLTGTGTIAFRNLRVDSGTRYVYDSPGNNLRYVVSPEGHVTENVYSSGLLKYSIAYTNDTYIVSATTPLTESALATWAASHRSGAAKVTEYVYDVRGALTQRLSYGVADSTALTTDLYNAVAPAGYKTEGYRGEFYVYDQSGRLRSKYTSSGSSGVAETYDYDGLGRVTVSTNGAGGRTTVVFNDAATTTTVTTQTDSNGNQTGQSYIVVSTYNKAGDLITVYDSGSSTGGNFTTGGTTDHVYDKNGRLRLTTDPTQPTRLRHFYLYDKAGLKVADIYADNSGSATGEIIEYRYDASGRLAATTRYANRLTTTQLTTLADPANEVEISAIRPAAHGYDIWEWTVYDAAGRVVETILGDGSVAGYEYDTAGRLTKTTSYYNKLAAGTVSGYMTNLPTATWPTALANDAITRTFYDRDGRVIGMLSAEGYLSKIVYDEAGQKIQEIAYANATTTTHRASGTYDQLLGTVTLDSARDISIRYVYDGQGLLRYTIDGINRVTETIYFTETTGMAVGLVRRTVAYATALGTVANYSYANIKSEVSALPTPHNNRNGWSVYNDRGQLKYAINQIRSDDVSGVWHPIGTVVRYDYDLAGNAIKTTQYAATIDMFGVATDTTTALDTWAGSNGTSARITRNYYAERGELRFSVDAEGYVSQYDYDQAARLRFTYRWSSAVAATDATLIAEVATASKGTSVSTETRYDASGRAAEYFDANGVRSYFGYYANGTRAWMIRSIGQGMDESRTEYRYNQAGRLVREFDHVSELTSASNLGASAIQVNGAQRLQSASTAYNAAVTREGELRLYHNGEVIWSNGVRETVSGATYRLVAQADGNLVVYRDVSGQSAVAIWSTSTSYSGVTYLIMQNSGNLELRKGTASADLGLVWSSGTTGVTASAYAAVYADTQYTYDGLGNVLTVIDQKGQTTTNTYDKAGHLLTTTKGGITSAHQYDAFGHGVKVTDALGNASYSYYDQAGRLVLTIDAEGYAVRTSYNAFDEVVTITRYANKATATGSLTTQPSITANSAADAVTTFVYDNLGQLKTKTGPEGVVESFTTDVFGNVVTATNKLGGVTTYVYDKLGRLTQEQLPVGSYNADGSLQAANVINKYSYDARGNRTQMIAAFGLTEQRTTNYEYDAGNRLVRTYHDALSVTTSAGATSTITPEERLIYDRRGNVIEAIDANGARALSWYDKLDRVTHQLSATGALTRYFYDLNGNVVETRAYETAVTLPADARGLAPAGTGAFRMTKYAYDALNRLTETRIPSIDVAAISGGTLSVTTQDLITTNVYDGVGNLVKVIDAAGKATWFYYDKAGNQTTIIDAENYRTDRTYDAGGNVLTEKRYYNASATPTGTTAPPIPLPTAHARDQSATFVYDKAGRRTLAVNGEGYAVATTYNGLDQIVTVTRYASPVTWSGGIPVVVTGAGDATTVMTYDVGGRLTNSANALNVSENYKLNAFGQQVRVTNRVSGITTYAYDKLGRMTVETLPIGAYNSSGTLVSANVINTYAYDAAGNRTRMVEASGLAEARITNYEYDLAGQLLRTYGGWTDVYASSTAGSSTSVVPESRSIYNVRGEVIETIDAGGGRNLFWYNKAGQLTHQLGATGTLTQFFYDKNGNTLEKRTYGTQLTLPANANGTAPSGTGAYRVIRYAYDGLNRQIETRVPSIDTAVYSAGVFGVAAADIVTASVYDAIGNLVKTIDPNGKATWFYYDRAGRQTVKIDAENYRTDWTYDADGNVLNERRYATVSTSPSGTGAPPAAPTTSTDDRITDFTYDKLGQRLTEKRASVKVFNGSNGENTQDSTVTYAYNGLGQVAQKTEGVGQSVTYTYDGGGRLITEARSAFTDFNNQSVTPTVDYYYNGLNDLSRTRQRGAAAVVDRVTTYAYGTGGRLDTMTDASGFVRTYRYDKAGRVVREEYTRVKPGGGSALEAVGTDYDLEGRTITTGVMTYTSSTWTRSGLDYVSTQYNAFGETSARGLNGVLAETFAYDAAGRMWRTTSGDGTFKYFMYDKAGNQTLAIVSDGTDISNQTMTWALDRWGATRSTIATTYVDGVVATITRYDGRNMAVEVLEPQRELNATTKQNLQTQRAYNAFGETSYEINAGSARIDYTYNTMGRLIKTESPTVSVTSEAGATTNVRPIEYRYYDLSGRLAASQDANGNLTKLTLLEGTGFGGTEALVKTTTTADGAVKTNRYSIHADIIVTTDQIGRQTWKEYDNMGRLVQTHSPGGLTDNFYYDGLGQIITRFNYFLGSGAAETTTYDAQGRIVTQVAAGGDTTTYTYTWSNSLVTTGLGTFGGWTQVTTYANSRTLTEQSDQFGRAISRTDLGGHTSASTYDKAGRLVLQDGGVNLNHSYFNTNRLATSWSLEGVTTSDDWLLRTQTNGYDAVGNLVSQSYEWDGEDAYYNAEYWVWVGQGPKPALPPFMDPESPEYGWEYHPAESGVSIIDAVFQNATATYDALGRLTAWSEAGGVPAASTTYQYDAQGNIRHTSSSFYEITALGVPGSSPVTRDKWYRFDALNRVVTSEGVFQGTLGSGSIVRGSQGMDVYYDDAGQRAFSLRTDTSSVITREDYTYDLDGRLIEVAIGNNASTPGVVRARYKYDLLGRLEWQKDYSSGGYQGSESSTNLVFHRTSTWNAKGQISTDTTITKRGSDTFQATATYGYGSGANYALGSPLTITTQNWTNGSSQATSETTNSYDWYEGAVTASVLYKLDVSQGTTQATPYTYEVIGGRAQLARVTIPSVPGMVTQTVHYRNDLSGQVLNRGNGIGSGAPTEFFYRFGGKEMGHITNDGTRETSYEQSIADRTTVQPSSPGLFHNGATSGTSYGAFAEGVDPITTYDQGSASGTYQVRAGETLGSIAANLWGDASLWYKLAEVNGLNGQSALTEGRQLMIPAGVMRSTHNASTFKPYDPAAALGELGPATPKPIKHNCGVIGRIFLEVLSTAITYALSELVGWLPAGAIGSAVSQFVGIQAGIQDKFSWTQVANSALTAAIDQGKSLEYMQAGKGLEAAAHALSVNAIGQGANIALGPQKKFDWTGFAVAGVGAYAGASTRGLFNGLPSELGLGGIAPLAGYSARGIAGAAAQSLIDGTDFELAFRNALPGIISSTIGEAISAALKATSDPVEMVVAEGDQTEGGVYPRGDGKLVTLESTSFEGGKLEDEKRIRLPNHLRYPTLMGDRELTVRQYENGLRVWDGERHWHFNAFADLQYTATGSIEGAGASLQDLSDGQVIVDWLQRYQEWFDQKSSGVQVQASPAMPQVATPLSPTSTPKVSISGSQGAPSPPPETRRVPTSAMDVFVDDVQEGVGSILHALWSPVEGLFFLGGAAANWAGDQLYDLASPFVGSPEDNPFVRFKQGAERDWDQFTGSFRIFYDHEGWARDALAAEKAASEDPNRFRGGWNSPTGNMAANTFVGGFAGAPRAFGSRSGLPAAPQVPSGKLHNRMFPEVVGDRGATPDILPYQTSASDAFAFQQYKKDLLLQEIANPGESMRGPVVLQDPVKGASLAQQAQIREYVAVANLAIDEGYMSPTGRVSTTGRMRADASAAASAERARAMAAGKPYSGVAAHGPDTTWTGLAQPPFWMDHDSSINSSIGRQAQNYPLGYRPTRFIYKGDM